MAEEANPGEYKRKIMLEAAKKRVAAMHAQEE